MEKVSLFLDISLEECKRRVEIFLVDDSYCSHEDNLDEKAFLSGQLIYEDSQSEEDAIKKSFQLAGFGRTSDSPEAVYMYKFANENSKSVGNIRENSPQTEDDTDELEKECKSNKSNDTVTCHLIHNCLNSNKVLGVTTIDILFFVQ